MKNPQQKAVYSAFAVLAVSLLALLFAVPYSTGYGDAKITLARMYQSLSSLQDWQHCFLVIPACLAILYLKRSELSKTPLGSNIWGLPLVLMSLAIFWIGFRVENHYIGFFSLQLFIIGYALWAFGWNITKLLLFPLMFLAFAWPLPFMDNIIAFPLRLIMSKASVAVLNSIGIPVILQGTGILSAPDALTGIRPGQRFSVDVADPCSGIRSLFALMMVSALYGYFTLKEGWQKWALFLCSIPLAILGNLCRILMLTFGTMAMGPTIAIGTLENPSFFHMAAGYLVFAVALGGMIGVGWLLQMLPRWSDTSMSRTEESTLPLKSKAAAKPTSAGKIQSKRMDPY